MSKRGKTKATSPIANWPWWQRGLVSFVVIVGVGGAFKYFEASQQRAVDAKVDQIVAEKEARETLSEAKSQGDALQDRLAADRATGAEANIGEGAKAAILSLTSDDLIGTWAEDPQSELFPDGVMRFSDGTTGYSRGGRSSGRFLLTIDTDQPLDLEGSYRVRSQGGYEVRGGRIYYSTGTKNVTPVIPANASSAKARAMRDFAQTLAQPDEPSDIEIIRFSGGVMVVRDELEDGRSLEVISRRK